MYILTKNNTIVGVNENVTIGKFKREFNSGYGIRCNNVIIAIYNEPAKDNEALADMELLNIYQALKNKVPFYVIDGKPSIINEKEPEEDETVCNYINYDLLEGQHVDAASLLSFMMAHIDEHKNESTNTLASAIVDYVFSHREGKKADINNQTDYAKSLLEENGYIIIKFTDAMKKACDKCENSDDCLDCPCNICIATEN